MAPRTVFLTGASGVVGRAVAAELGGARVVGLVHRNAEVPEVDAVLIGDLALPRFGLDAEAWRRLAGEVDAVIHSGALTTWGLEDERYREVNVEGTRIALELAREAEAPLHFVSTCFVHALERGSREDLAARNVVAPYISSKLEAERLLAASEVPHAIYRPTNIVGDSRTGASSEPQIVQAMSEWICRGKAPYLPAHPGNRIDVVPLDVVAIAIARAVEAEDLGVLSWLAYGERAMSVEAALAVLAEHAAAGGRTLAEVPIADPRQPLPVPLERIPPMSRTFLEVLIDVSEVTHACGGVLPSSLPRLCGEHGVPDVSDQLAYWRSLEYWAARRGAHRLEVEAA